MADVLNYAFCEHLVPLPPVGRGILTYRTSNTIFSVSCPQEGKFVFPFTSAFAIHEEVNSLPSSWSVPPERHRAYSRRYVPGSLYD